MVRLKYIEWPAFAKPPSTFSLPIYEFRRSSSRMRTCWEDADRLRMRNWWEDSESGQSPIQQQIEQVVTNGIGFKPRYWPLFPEAAEMLPPTRENSDR